VVRFGRSTRNVSIDSLRWQWYCFAQYLTLDRDFWRWFFDL
jgi:hypothetical protein